MGLSDRLKNKLKNLQSSEDKSILDVLKKTTEKSYVEQEPESITEPQQITSDSSVNEQPPAQIVLPTQLAGDVYSKKQEQIKQQKLQNFTSRLSLNNLLSLSNKIKDSIVNNTPSEETVAQKFEQIVTQKYDHNTTLDDKPLSQIIEENKEYLTVEDEQFISDIDEELKERYEEETGTKLSDDVSMLEVIENIDEVLNDSHETRSTNISLGDFEITNKTNKNGYTKTVVGFKKDTPAELSRIATFARKISDNLIKPRTMDVININNINKTQLKSSNVKLGLRSFVFKPDGTRMKVPKFTRFIISLEEDFTNTKMVLVYLQSSRNKIVFKTDCDIEFLGKLIYSFFKEGFETTKRKLQFKYSQDPLLRAIPNLVKSGEYKVQPANVDEENQKIKSLKIKSKGTKNQWLTVSVKLSKNVEGAYDVWASSDFDNTWNILVNKGLRKDGGVIDFAYLNSEAFINGLTQLWNNKEETFKTAGLDLSDPDNIILMQMSKLKHRNLKKAYMEMIDLDDTENEINVHVSETLSQIDTKEILELGKQNDYNAECIVGKTNFVEYFIITYYAKLIEGGDKRAGREYITSQEYYEKYGVKDRSEYENRRNTILTKEEKERNYNARPYIFRIEYKINGKEKVNEAATFEELLEKTNLLTSNPK